MLCSHTGLDFSCIFSTFFRLTSDFDNFGFFQAPGSNPQGSNPTNELVEIRSAPLVMASVRGDPGDATAEHHEVICAQATGQAPLPNGVVGTRDDRPQGPSTTREPVGAPVTRYGNVEGTAEGNVAAQASRDESQSPPVAATDQTLRTPVNTGEEPGPQQAGLMQALTTMDPGRHPDPGSVLSASGSVTTPEFLTPTSRMVSQGQGSWLGRNVMEGWPRWVTRLGAYLAPQDGLARVLSRSYHVGDQRLC